MPSRNPPKLFTDNQRRIAEDAANSAYLDSRIEKWCKDTGADVPLHRQALIRGYTIRFYGTRNGRSVLLHSINPKELR